MTDERETISSIMDYLGQMSSHLLEITQTISLFGNILKRLEHELSDSPYLATQPKEADEIERLEALKELAGRTA
tara:strand:+ start:235 stop:456 length:222 start_codon:yes stop_codon:yes gene_type:complete